MSVYIYIMLMFGKNLHSYVMNFKKSKRKFGTMNILMI